MEPEPNLILDVTIALTIALAGGWLAARLRLASIVGYIVAGIIISPFTPGFVGDVDRLRLLADIGVVLLLFAIGVQFSLSELAEAGPRVVAGALVQTAAITGAMIPLGMLLGWTTDESLYIGAAAAISSSVVLVKLLDARAEVGTDHGRSAISWSIVQDFAAIVVIVVLGALTGDSGGSSLGQETAVAGVKAVGFVAVVMVLGLRVVPIILNQIAEERSRELFFLAIAAMAIGTALASEYAGLSLALGAFLAGVVVSELDLSHRVLGELMPARDVFAVLFFVAAGMLIEPSVLVDQWLSVLVVVALVAIVKPLLTFVIYRYGLRATPRTAMLAAAMLIPIAEFTFLLANAGLDSGALSDDAFGVILAAAIISIILSPLLVNAVDWFASRTGGHAIPLEPHTTPASIRLGRKAVICGFDRPGQIVASIVAPRFDIIVFESNHKLAKQARARGYEVIESSSVSPAMLEQMDLTDARVLVITLADPFIARLLAERALQVNPHLNIIASAAGNYEAEKLHRSGIAHTVVGDDEAALELARHSLHRFGVSSRESLAVIQTYRARARTAN